MAAPHAPVVYLRAFESDGSSGVARLSASSDEEQLMVALRAVGKAVAIGRPSEALPHLGASRLYLSDSDWQQRVAAMIRAARLVVVRTGVGDGLRWEIEHVMRAVSPEQLLVVVGDDASFQAFRAWTSSVVSWEGADLRFKKCLGSSINGFITFDRHWKPSGIPLRRFSPLRATLLHWVEFRWALAGLFRTLKQDSTA